MLALLAALALPAAAAARPTHRTVPKGFFGTVIPYEMGVRTKILAPEAQRMRETGVEAVRTVFYWSEGQPYRTMAEVPADARASFREIGGIPTTFAAYDPIVRSLARQHLGLLPTVLNAPFWAGTDWKDPGLRIYDPADPADYAHFLTALIGRYGPQGSFWRENPRLPKVPIREWQIWNEPHLGYYWRDDPAHGRPWQTTYTALLKASWEAVHAADPGAKAVLGGLTYFSWQALPKLYKAGARRWFDVVAVHPYSMDVGNIPRILALDRTAMRRNHDGRKPIYVTETTWPAAKGRTKLDYGYNVTPKVQAQKVGREMGLLAKRRKALGLTRVYWYKWASFYSGDSDPFDYAGLRALTPTGTRSEPSFFTFRRTVLRLEGRR